MKKNIIIKAYTDIEQSKKLAKILPLKSADMYYLIKRGDCRVPWEEAAKDDTNVILFTREVTSGNLSDYKLPCWSLAALMNVLPRYLNYNDDKLRLNLYTLDFENQYRKDHCWIVGYWDYDEETEEYNFQIQAKENEVIDACYELILKLNERKLLN